MELDLARVSGRDARPGLVSNAEEFVMDDVEATELWWVKMAYDFRGVCPALRPRCRCCWIGLFRAARDLVRTAEVRVAELSNEEGPRENARIVSSEG
jgi:hypothetical protein